MKKGGGIGFVILIIAVAIVMYLWASNAKEVVPTLESAGQEIEEIAGPGELPNLGEMEAATSRHAEELKQALGESDD